MKRLLAGLLFLPLLACVSGTPAPAPAAAPVHLVVVGTTDVHGWFNGHTETPKGGEAIQWGGLPILAGYLDALRAANPGRVVVVDSGDLFQGTLESNLFEGEPMVKGYNALGYAAAAVGNHEFDYGPVGPDSVPRKPGDDPLGALKRNAANATFPFLSANLKEKATGQTPAWAHGSTLLDAGGVKLGIIGLSTPDTPNVTMGLNVVGLDFTEPVEATLRAAADLRAHGADAVIVIAHMGGRCTDVHDPHDTHSCEVQQESWSFLQTLPAGTIDAYFGGHTHAQVRQYINGVPAAQALAYSRELSAIDLWVDPRGHHVTRTDIRPLTMLCTMVYSGTETCDPKQAPKGASLVPKVFEGKTIVPDAKVAALLAPYMAQVATKRNEKLGIRTAGSFGRAYQRESALGDLLSDVLRDGMGADLAFFNSGGIRAALRGGELVYSDIFEVSPFDNYAATVMMTGAQIGEALRLTTSGERGILQVSGIRYTYDAALDPDKPAAQRNRLITVTLADGSPLGPDKLYKVAMPDFLSAGGDGLQTVMEGIPADRKTVDQSRTIRDLFSETARKYPMPLTPKTEGRITVLHPPSESTSQ
jgi:5'-nucleotidase